MKFGTVLATEFAKLRRSKVTWLTLAVYTFLVVVGGLFMWMMLNPGTAERLGLLGQKANLTVGGLPANWSSFLMFIGEMGGVGGLMMCSIIVTYLFGREYTEGTAKNLLALPVPRVAFVLAKITVGAVWFGALTLWMIPETYVVGSIVGLPGFSTQAFLSMSVKLLVLAPMSLACASLVGWVAVETRGLFAPLGFTMFALLLSTLFGHTGWGRWVPWSIVGLYSGASGPEIELSWGSYIVLAATFMLGVVLTARHEVYADNGQ